MAGTRSHHSPPPGTAEHRTALQSTQLALAEAKQRIAAAVTAGLAAGAGVLMASLDIDSVDPEPASHICLTDAATNGDL